MGRSSEEKKTSQTTIFMNTKNKNACFMPETFFFLVDFEIGLYVVSWITIEMIEQYISF